MHKNTHRESETGDDTIYCSQQSIRLWFFIYFIFIYRYSCALFCFDVFMLLECVEWKNAHNWIALRCRSQFAAAANTKMSPQLPAHSRSVARSNGMICTLFAIRKCVNIYHTNLLEFFLVFFFKFIIVWSKCFVFRSQIWWCFWCDTRR